MEAIELRDDLREALERGAAQAARSVNDLVNEAVQQYLDRMEREKIETEAAAYEQLHPHLKSDHFGEWVAIHNEQLVDHDPDRLSLHRRVRARYGSTAVLIRRVTDAPIEEVWFRTPSTGKLSP
jgi:hypothetical protein